MESLQALMSTLPKNLDRGYIKLPVMASGNRMVVVSTDGMWAASLGELGFAGGLELAQTVTEIREFLATAKKMKARVWSEGAEWVARNSVGAEIRLHWVQGDNATPIVEMVPDTVRTLHFTTHQKKALTSHMSKDFSRPNICGWRVDQSGYTATDGHRLLHYVAQGYQGEPVTLPFEFAKVFSALRAHGVCWVGRDTRGNHVFATSDLTFAPRAGSGNHYPNLDQILPRTVAPFTVKVDSKAVAGAILPGKDCVTLAVSGYELTLDGVAIGKSEAYHDGVARWGMNPKYLVEATTAVVGEVVVLELWDVLQPIIVRGELEGYAVVMPMRLK
jgi:hypothetical protein